MLLEQMLSGQMFLSQLESVLDVPRNLLLKFGQNQVSNSWEMLSKSLCGGASIAYMVINWASMAYMVVGGGV